MITNCAKIYKYDGRSMTLKEWSSELGIKLVTLYHRLRKGWPISMVLGLPIDVSKASRRRVYTYNGRTATAAEWARITGIPEDTLHYRLTHKKIWSVEKALTTPYTPTAAKHPIRLTLNGETKSVTEWAAELGVRAGTLRMRIYRGGSVEEILNPIVEVSRLHKPLNVTFNGETHNLSEWAAITGISTATLSLRLHSGWKLNDVFGRDVASRGAKKFELNGESKTLLEWAKQYGQSTEVVRSRLRIGWDLRKALVSPLHFHSRAAKSIRCNGRNKTIGEWARQYGSSETVVRSRLRMGRDLMKALLSPVGPRGRKPKLVSYNGCNQTLGEWAKKYGTSENILRTRLSQGWSMERALKTPKRRVYVIKDALEGDK